MSLAKEALTVKKKPKPHSDVSPLKDAMKEAWEASKKDDFDRFAEAFSDAMDIKLYSHNESEEGD